MKSAEPQNTQSGIVFLVLAILLALLFIIAVAYRTYQIRSQAAYGINLLAAIEQGTDV